MIETIKRGTHKKGGTKDKKKEEKSGKAKEWRNKRLATIASQTFTY